MIKRRNKSPIFKFLLDISFSIIAALAVLSQTTHEKWKAAEKVVVEKDGRIDDLKEHVGKQGEKIKSLEDDVSGYQGALADADRRFSDLHHEGEQKNGIIIDLRKQIGVLKGNLGQLTEELARLQPAESVEISVLVDATASMRPTIDQLRSSLKSLFDWTPYLARECRIGVLAFRDGVVHRYQLQKVQPAYKDGGLSQRKLMSFLDGLRTEGSPTNHRPVFEEAIEMLPAATDGRKQLILLLGDIGVSELDGRVGQNAAERAKATEIVRLVHQWASQGRDRSVGAIYVGASNTSDHRWYQSLTYPRGENFSTNSAEIFSVIMRSIRPQGVSNDK